MTVATNRVSTILAAAKQLTVEDCMEGLPVAVAKRHLAYQANGGNTGEAYYLLSSFWASNPLRDHEGEQLNARIHPRGKCLAIAAAWWVHNGGDNVEGFLLDKMQFCAAPKKGDGLAKHEGELHEGWQVDAAAASEF